MHSIPPGLLRQYQEFGIGKGRELGRMIESDTKMFLSGVFFPLDIMPQ